MSKNSDFKSDWDAFANGAQRGIALACLMCGPLMSYVSYTLHRQWYLFFTIIFAIATLLSLYLLWNPKRYY